MNFKEFKEKYQKKEVEEISFSPPREPVVSVLVQTYKQKNFIKDCLDSILMQETTFDFEILVGDDGSTDGTREICLEYAEKYPERIRLFLHHRENQIRVLGEATSNFNAFYNFFSARGKYIAFCEGDDKWTDSFKLQNQIDMLMVNSTWAFAYHLYIEVDENDEFLPKEITLKQPTNEICEGDLKKVSFHPLLSTICFRNCIEEKIPEEMLKVINVDTFLISLLGNYGAGGFIKSIKPSYYRRLSGGVWSGQRKDLKYKSKILTYQKLISYYTKEKDNITAKVLKQELRKIYKQAFFFYINKGKVIPSLNILVKIF